MLCSKPATPAAKAEPALALVGLHNGMKLTGLLGLDDKNGDGRLQLTPDAATNEIQIDRDIIVLSTPEVAGLAPWVIALVAAGSGR